MDITSLLRAARETGVITPSDLYEILQANSAAIRLVDATYPVNASLPKIANAATFDIDAIADPENPMAHMLPSADLFAREVGSLGIGNCDFVIAYDAAGITMAASRAWWMFRVFGHDNVAVLDGGLPAWIAGNYPVSNGGTRLVAKNFTAVYRPELVMNFDQMQKVSSTKSALILDARPADRFGPDHIPNSVNLPALGLMDMQRRLRPPGIDISPESEIVATCGSGVTACTIALSLYREGHKNVSVYDGSWTEWSSRL